MAAEREQTRHAERGARRASRLGLALGMATLLCATAAQAQAPDPVTLLKRALGTHPAYDGAQTSTLHAENGPVTSTVVVQSDGAGSIRRAYGADQAIIVLRTPKGMFQRDASGRWIALPVVAERDPAVVAREIARNYRLRLLPCVTLLGRRVWPLYIEPKQRFDPGRRLWIDSETGLPLRDELLAPDGRLRSSSAFTRVRFGPQPASLFAPPAEAAGPALFGPSSFHTHATREEVERETGRAILLPSYVPPGYQTVQYGDMQTRMGLRMPAVRYSNGLSSFTIFQRGFGGGRRMGPERGMGLRSNRQQAVVEHAGRRANYLLIGDLTESELRRVAESLP